jgi:hypothetical protein
MSRYPAPAGAVGAADLVSTAFVPGRFCGRVQVIDPSVAEHFTVVTAPLDFRETGKHKRLQCWQPWSYRRLVAYSFLGLSEGA